MEKDKTQKPSPAPKVERVKMPVPEVLRGSCSVGPWKVTRLRWVGGSPALLLPVDYARALGWRPASDEVRVFLIEGKGLVVEKNKGVGDADKRK